MSAVFDAVIVLYFVVFVAGFYCFLSLPRLLRDHHPELWRELKRPSWKRMILSGGGYGGASRPERRVYAFAKAHRDDPSLCPAVSWRCKGVVYLAWTFWALMALAGAVGVYVMVAR